MRSAIRVFFGIWLLVVGQARAKDEYGDSVVKIRITQRAPDLVKPWAKASPKKAVGSGVIIQGKRILTNAHVVRHAGQIFVQGNQSTEKLPARVVFLADDADLALIELDDESFFDDRPALPLAEELPYVRDTVNVYGYPTGGEQLSVTEGIVSRIEYAAFHDYCYGLRIQIDAALNPGNSGGPAIVGGQVVGLVFRKIKEGENIGYLIAVDEILMFLEDIKDGSYDGKPVIRDQLQVTENPSLRDRLGLKDETGLMVREPYGNDDSYPLKQWDVITHVADYSLDHRGMVQFNDDLRLSWQYLVPKLVTDGTIGLSVLRDGKSIDIAVPVYRGKDLVVPFLSGEYPRYFICGPMIFQQATQELIARVAWSSGKNAMALHMLRSPLLAREFDRRGFEGEELVVLGASLFPHRIATGYSGTALGVVTHVDDTSIRNLAHLVECMRDASGEYITFTIAGLYSTLVFNREEFLASTEEILSDEGIRKQYSSDLAEIWEKSD